MWKPLNLSEIEFLGNAKNHIYINWSWLLYWTLMRYLLEKQSQWPNLCDTTRLFDTFFSSTTVLSRNQWSPFFSNWLGRQNFMLAMHSVLQKSVKFMKRKYITYFCPYDWDYSAWPTRCNISRGHGTLCVSPSSFLPPSKRLWNSYLCNNSIVLIIPLRVKVYSLQRLYPLRHNVKLGAKVCLLYWSSQYWVSATTGLIHTTNRNLLKSSFSEELWDHLLAYTLDSS